MYYNQIRVDVRLGCDVKFKDAGEFISKAINKAILYDKELSSRHKTVNTANDIYEYLLTIESEYSKNNIFLLTSAVAPRVRKCIIKKI